MVAKDNPKKITSIKDLAREDVRTSMPNPINEGIMQFYIRKVLERHGIWQVISAVRNAFLARRRKITGSLRCTSARHQTGSKPVSRMPVWSGRPKSLKRIVPVRMSTLFRYRMKTVYAPMSPMLSVPYIAKMRMLAFLQSSQGQDAYAKFGFVKASETELKLRPIN
ncbi:MAG TPA: substrate-binding domain-containing protein [Pseudolabrys sp.]|nr:substrate-binding domain-containing protein [Pseudolabrys sp.]